MKILFIGNSYTYYNDMPNIFQKLAEENGKCVFVDSVTKGGRKLYENLDAFDENGKLILELCEKNDYDILFLQENSLLPIKDFSAFENGVAGLKNLAQAKRTVLYVTWGRKSGSAALDEFSMSSEEMSDLLYERYCAVGKSIGAEVSPVGPCFKFINSEYPMLDLYNKDLSHPSYLGSTVAAICHYITAFGEEPKNISSLPLDDEAISTIKNTFNLLKQLWNE